MEYDAADDEGESGPTFGTNDFRQQQARLRNRLLTIALAAILVFGFIAVLVPDRAAVIFPVMAAVAAITLVMLKLLIPR